MISMRNMIILAMIQLSLLEHMRILEKTKMNITSLSKKKQT